MSFGTAPASAAATIEFEQTGLFELQSEEPVLYSEKERIAAGRKLLNQLLLVRRRMDPVQKAEFFSEIEALITTIRTRSRLKDSQIEELILQAIECHGACTPNEIAEDTRLSREVVDAVIHSLAMRAVIYQTRRYVPGSDRPQFMIKSRRQKSPEATQPIFHRKPSVWEELEDC